MPKRNGFTIVELLIVIIVIAILATITIVAYNGITQQSKSSQRAAVARILSNALENYYTLNGTYPTVDQMTCANNDNTPKNTFITNTLNVTSLDVIATNCGAIYNNHYGLSCVYFMPTNTAPFFGSYSLQGAPDTGTFNYCSNKQTSSMDSRLNMNTYNCYSTSNSPCIGYVLTFFTGSTNTPCSSIGFKNNLGFSYVCSISNVHGTFN